MEEEKLLVRKGYDPLIIVSKLECEYASKINLSDNDKFPLPYYLHPIKKIKILDPVTEKPTMSWVLGRLEKDGIPYVTKKIDIADYIVKNKNTDEIFVIKRIDVQTILDMWANKRKGYYQGKRGFEDMIKDLRRNFSVETHVILAIEDYYSTLFDNTSNTIWTSWKLKYSKKRDSRDRPKYCMLNFKRHNIHPYSFHNSLRNLKKKYGIEIKFFFDGKGLYSYIVNELIYSRDYGEIYEKERRIEYFMNIAPFLTRERAESLIEEHGNIYNAITVMLKGSVKGISNHELKKWRRLLKN